MNAHQEYEAHARKSRQEAVSLGLSDCIHFAPNWASRSNALYNRLAEMGGSPDFVGLLSDGRMVVTGKLLPLGKRPRAEGNFGVSVFEAVK